MAIVRRFVLLILTWFGFRREAPPAPPLVNDATPVDMPPAVDALPKIDEPPPQPVEVPPIYLEHKAKWVKPKGERPKSAKRATSTAPRVARPKVERRTDVMPNDDPEKWGQYYFRDAILDQLDQYFVFLRRLKRGDRDVFKLFRQVGIQVVPPSAIIMHDALRHDDEVRLSPWFLDTRPTFGAVAYGLDKQALKIERYTIADLPDEYKHTQKDIPDDVKAGTKHRVETITKRDRPKWLPKEAKHIGVIWVPRFLYYFKHDKPPKDVQRLGIDGDTYLMAVYWDRVDHTSRAFDRRQGGVVQEYAVLVDRAGNTQVLKYHLFDRVKVHSKRYGKVFIPRERWMVPDEYLSWTRGRDISPEDYLRRLFIEATSLYECAAVGSMIRVEASRGDLVAAFGVDIRRTPYFFRDRDVVLNEAGTTKRIFHIVRAHERVIDSGVSKVRMHFRGERDFDWAGYHVHISIPGRDHFLLPEFNVGIVQKDDDIDQEHISTGKLGSLLKTRIHEGLGAWVKPKQ